MRDEANDEQIQVSSISPLVLFDSRAAIVAGLSAIA
jgi:hypothetical protein